MTNIQELSATHPKLADELFLLDRVLDGAILHDPTHTISYSIALKAKQGHPVAQWLCARLNLISPNHCAHALANEASQQWAASEKVSG